MSELAYFFFLVRYVALDMRVTEAAVMIKKTIDGIVNVTNSITQNSFYWLPSDPTTSDCKIINVHSRASAALQFLRILWLYSLQSPMLVY